MVEVRFHRGPYSKLWTFQVLMFEVLALSWSME